MKTFFPYLLTLLSICFTNAQNIDINLVKEGFNNPVNLQNAGDDRLFVVEQNGVIKILNADGTVNATPFLDISTQVSCCNERGLLGLAFHPDYATNGYFFVNYTNTNGNTQVSRFSVSGSNANVADPNSELAIIGYNQPNGNHNGGCLAFGPDGYLYIASGDGGGSGDTDNNAQNLLKLLGKILRIDIDNTSGGNNYAIPPGNPFIGNPDALDEIWAYGVRNPWKFSFDFTEGTIWIADVGQNQIEEVNKQPATAAGLNYGWRCYEGSDPFNTNNCPPQGDLVFPVAEYNHSVGSSVTGGYVYRGSEFPNLQGIYVFADFISGFLATVDENNNYVNYGDFGGNWSSFGEGVDKTLYAVNYSGSIYKVIDTDLGVSENENAISVKLYPNPANGEITVSLSKGNIHSVEIFDTKGSLLVKKEGLNGSETKITTSSFKSGIYFIKITDSSRSIQNKRFIIK
ncbi:PQQ-dependent sugar dehydrogenase [Marixanthomonas spongiae]|uniref:T9SS C-terminal target domain-containing protein n=1 Tax=Marixanthomonas spongiae TaxID=2174845 RepID=A0A2U0I5Y3_9FLAO|nr:PQQ-dependent sugar dehydrogenase [Marixanthomonas spongiae]PVW16517.1 hypothetical protein DDV96_04505 [Marixanthomonas spongiae]